MNINKLVPTSVSRSLGSAKLSLHQNSPHILFGVGAVGVVAATVMACKATLKLPEKVEVFQEDVTAVKRELVGTEEYKKDLAYTYIRGISDIGKLYGPSIVVGGLSLASLASAHITLSNRNTSLTVAYAGLNQAFHEYRNRVREELGEDKERDIYHGVEHETVTVDGKKKQIDVLDPNRLSIYSKIFDESSPEWQQDPELNRIFLTLAQNYWNHRLHARGHVFLNEVYDHLGFNQTQTGSVVGWMLGHPTGDDFVDFGIFERGNSRFVNGSEDSIILDFNVAGVINNRLKDE